MAQKVDKDQYAVRVIPDNATDTGKVLNGLFKKRNLIEAAILAAPIALFLWYIIPADGYEIRLRNTVFGAIVFGGIGIIGIPPYSLFEYIGMMLHFRKSKHYAKFNPRLKWETKPEFLVAPAYGSLGQYFSNLFNKATASTDDMNEPIAEDIFAPRHVEVFRDDPDKQKSKAEIKAEDKARKRRLKKKEKERRRRLKEGR